MSVLISAKFSCDVARFQNALASHKEYFLRFGEVGRSMGRMHHRVGVGDGFVLVLDEWDTVSHFHSFYAAPELKDYIREIGTSTIPSAVTIAEAIASPSDH